jgi:hypothetical protein
MFFERDDEDIADPGARGPGSPFLDAPFLSCSRDAHAICTERALVFAEVVLALRV